MSNLANVLGEVRLRNANKKLNDRLRAEGRITDRPLKKKIAPSPLPNNRGRRGRNRLVRIPPLGPEITPILK